MLRFSLAITFTLVATLLSSVAVAQVKQQGVWTDPQDESIPASFVIQGEYSGEVDGGAKVGAQVIALDEAGALQAVVYPGGLPGEGWDGENKILLAAELKDGTAEFSPAEGNRNYMNNDPQKFSATQQFPPAGQADWTGSISAGIFSGKTADGKSFVLKKTERKSPTLGATAPDGAVVLFNGSNMDQWDGGRLDEETKLLNTDARDLRSKEKFKAYTMHLEFLLPFRPTARGQKRGNSGFFQTNGQEVQVLDSFGLDGLKNECGALYGRRQPDVNMCYPPLVWQTFDVELVPNPENNNPNAGLLTVRHNGVLIHDKIPSRLGSNVYKLQGHGNLLQYRNIWLVEKEVPGDQP